MNIRKITAALFAVLSMCLMVSCNTIMDKKEDCPIDLSVQFVRQSPCDLFPIPIQSLENIRILAFDVQGKLLSQSRLKTYNSEKTKQTLINLPEDTHLAYFWAGVGEAYSLKNVQNEQDIYLELVQQYLEQNSSTTLSPLYHGMIYMREVQEVKEGESIAIKLKEITNRISVELELDNSVEDKDIKDFEVTIKSANGVYSANGEMPLPQKQIDYSFAASYDSNQATFSFHLLDLKMGHFNQLIIKDKKSGELIYEGDLIGSILLKNYNLNLDCTNDFKLKFVIADKCKDCETYECVKIIVNDWIIYSRDVELGQDALSL